MLPIICSRRSPSWLLIPDIPWKLPVLTPRQLTWLPGVFHRPALTRKDYPLAIPADVVRVVRSLDPDVH